MHPITDAAQAGLETGWMIKGIDNNIYGITKGSSWTGKTKLVTTTEYFDTDDKKFVLPEQVLNVQYRPDKGDYKIAPIYATAKNYASVMHNCIDMVERIVKEQGL
ncbi:MAG: hypothetical protein LBR46_05310 [Prevotella sp.]|nr:hypothetical protein [Prevotella sp.]